MSVGKLYLLAVRTRCQVSIDPLHTALPDIEGIDSWQALELAMELVERLLRVEVENGDKLYWLGDNDVQSEYEFEL